MFLADLHVHSQFSDGVLSISELVDFYGQRGFGCVAITDHLCERRTILGVAARCMNVTLTEKTFPKYIETINRIARAIRGQEGVAIAAHPISTGKAEIAC